MGIDSGMIKVFVVVLVADLVVRFLLAQYPTQSAVNF